ncbi:alpha/beta hydrolase [Rhodococcoides trifolii]|uniref:alpha/beta hydrolase n=1 Tax=Rhodococcoides trifolii TaxID=908250 RepID=UPI001E32A74A|nr:alpha/beta hydrolase [Rhodococcus trifolii]
MTTYEGLVYIERDSGPLALDLVTPDGGGPWPLVVFVHGGGWMSGDRTLAPSFDQYFCARGLAMASVSYRFSADALFPAQLHDVRSAVRFLRASAEEFGLDPDRFAIWGSSAGGHLAALTGLTSATTALPGEVATDGDASVSAVAESYGPATLVGGEVTAPASLPGMDTPASTPEGRLLGGDPVDHPELAHAASPIHQVTADAPPFQISHGTADVLVGDDHSIRLLDALTAAGVDAELYLLDGYQHGFLNPPGRPDAPVFDSGRLAAEGTARARRLTGHGSTRTDEPADFGFDVIGDFFTRHLGAS